jgi:hypothetical protein
MFQQIFTAIGMQLPGSYLKHGDKNQPLGPIVTVVYRSWAFMQKSTVEEFLTDDGNQRWPRLASLVETASKRMSCPGVPYWYDRRTGQTFWERPLMPLEKVPVKEGGTGM